LVPIGVRVRVTAGVVEDAMVLVKVEAVEVVVVLIGIGFTGVVVVFVEAGGSGFLVPNGVLGFTGVETEAVFTGLSFAPSATLATLAIHAWCQSGSTNVGHVKNAGLQ
jgi:hypothetical protein